MKMRNWFVVAVPLVGMFLGGCSSGSDDDATAGTPGADSPTPEPASPTPDFSDPVVRGEYIARASSGCDRCHTPRLATGEPDQTRFMAGTESLLDLDPEDDNLGNVPAPNLTTDETGLADWTDAEIKHAFLDGIGRDGNPLVPVMPYFVFHNMSPDDADAIVAYLRTLEPIDHEIPPRQPLPFNLPGPAMPVPLSAIPDTTLPSSDADYELAQRGRYVASSLGACMFCHTSTVQGPTAINLDKLYGGGQVFQIAQYDPTNEAPALVYSTNLTPDATGIQGWTVEQVVDVLREGVDKEGHGVCPPMSFASGPIGPFVHLTEEDVQAIATFVTTMAPIENAIPQQCTAPQ